MPKKLACRAHPRSSGCHFRYSFTYSGLTTALHYFSSRWTIGDLIKTPSYHILNCRPCHFSAGLSPAFISTVLNREDTLPDVNIPLIHTLHYLIR
jgi:hypothetical protein